MGLLDKALDQADTPESIIQVPQFIEGDNVIVIEASTWKSLIGKSGTVIKNDANPSFGDGHKKIKVDYEDGAVGWFWPKQLRLDNDINSLKDIVRHFDRMGLSPDQKDHPREMTLETKHLIMIRDVVQMALNKKNFKI